MTTRIWRMLGAAGLALMLAATASSAPAPTTRIRAQIEKIEGNTMTLKTRDGGSATFVMPADVRVAAMIKATLADLKPDTYIGVTAMPQADGSQKAIAIHIFQANQRGAGEGHREWDLRPGSTMTNAAIETTVAGADGQVLTVKYKQGDRFDEKKVIVTPETAIVRYVPGDKAELKPGVHIIIGAAAKQADGSFTAPNFNYGRDGIVPPM